MNTQSNWNARLLQIAKDNADLSGTVGDKLRSSLARYANVDKCRALELAHARAREAVVTGTRMALRCGAILNETPASDLPFLLRVTGVSDKASTNYARIAQEFPVLSQLCARRNGRITERQALQVLQAIESDPMLNLFELAQIAYQGGA